MIGDQASSRLRCEWGADGGAVVARGADVAVVVDVCSFTTTTSVALDRGIAVIPSATRPAVVEPGVVVAGRRSEGGVSLSPGSVRRAWASTATGDPVEPPPGLLVLPSPNGSTISAALASTVPTVLAACLRNASAVGAWLAARPDLVVAVVPAGERWPDGGLRPAVEDLWGAGAVLSTLVGDGLSPEARMAAAAFAAVRPRLRAELRACTSGRELTDLGFPEDVEVASELDTSTVVPTLVDGAFRPA